MKCKPVEIRVETEPEHVAFLKDPQKWIKARKEKVNRQIEDEQLDHLMTMMDIITLYNMDMEKALSWAIDAGLLTAEQALENLFIDEEE